jgi:hypothetical protein
MRLPSSECPHCGARLAGVTALALRCPACRHRPRPYGLCFALTYSLMTPVACLLALGSVLNGTAAVDVEGRVVTGLAADLATLAIFVATLPGAPVAYGLWHHLGWTRAALVAWLVWMTIVILPTALLPLGLEEPVSSWFMVVVVMVSVPVVWLYLYASREINEYYAAIARRDGHRTPV